MTSRLVPWSRSGARPGWTALVVVMAVVAVTPMTAVVLDALIVGASVGQGFGSIRLPEMVITTVAVMVGVAIGTLGLGGGLAWLVTAYLFPGRSVLAWLLVLPLAMPAYVLGFVFLSVFDFAGPVQSGVRAVFGADAWFPEVRSLPGAVVVLSLSLYPYVYLLARAALLEQSPATYEAARTLGASPHRAAWRVVLPLARPSLAAGAALIMMETLTDFATVRYFNVQTVSVGVYQVWKGTFDLHAATQLAALVLIFAVAVIVGERALRGRARYHQGGGPGGRRGRPGGYLGGYLAPGLPTMRLTGWPAAAATASCVLTLAVAFALPVGQLLWWSGRDIRQSLAGALDSRYLAYLGNSLAVACVVAFACAAVALVLDHTVRLTGGRVVRSAAQLTTVGYAVPGVVVAIGVLIASAALDDGLQALGVAGRTGLLITSSGMGIVVAYVVRFLAPAYQSVDASFQKVSPAMTFSALSLGAGPCRVLTRVHLPLVRSGVGVALVLVLVDALKELPIVLLLRPFGFTTLSVWVWQQASESRWEGAALPALTIVAAALVPVLLLFGRSRAPDPGPGT
ncbi:MAG: iron ABC transporter permease [Acidothermales bacterium]|nr:iron ABC transporter permease [Acidothermales bacterium]